MGRTPVIMGLMSVVLFVITAVYIAKHMRTLQPPPAQAAVAPAITHVVVAATDLPLGTALRPEHLRAVEWPPAAVPPGAVGDPAALLGLLTIAWVAKNEPLLPDKLLKTGGQSLLPLKIPPGRRAVSVRVNDVTGISGFVAPGTRVDVIAVTDLAGGAGRSAFTLLENIEVLAIAQQMEQRSARPTIVKTVTLLVTPRQAERLALAGTAGTLQLALRSYVDSGTAGTSGTSMAQLAGGPKRHGRTVELIQGNSRTVQSF